MEKEFSVGEVYHDTVGMRGQFIIIAIASDGICFLENIKSGHSMTLRKSDMTKWKQIK